MRLSDPFTLPPADAVAVGTGRLTLDVVVRDGNIPPLAQAGGTCGNVLAVLAYLGWRAYPLGELGDDDPGHRFAADLARFGVPLDLVRLVPDQETPVIVHRIAESPGGAVHSFSSLCPFCRRPLQEFEPPTRAAVEERLLGVPATKVFFFDRDSEGALLLARHCRERGGLVVYEPAYAGPESQLDDSLGVAHVLKFSREQLPDLAARALGTRPWLLVETLGRGGLRYCDQRQGSGQWRHLPACPVEVVRDAGGAGDWCTAGFLHLAAREGAAGLPAGEDLAACLRFGQALAAWNCAFEGARGGVYRVDRARFQADVHRILAGETLDPAAVTVASTQDVAGRFCRGCGGRG